MFCSQTTKPNDLEIGVLDILNNLFNIVYKQCDLKAKGGNLMMFMHNNNRTIIKLYCIPWEIW